MEYNFPKVNYIGNKIKLMSWIADNLPIKEGHVLDLFSGGGAVSFELKKRGFRVTSNDSLYASYVLSKTLIENKYDTIDFTHIYSANSKEVNKITRDKLSWLENHLYYPDEVDELSNLVDYSQNLKDYDKYIFQSLIRRAMIRKLPYSRMNITWKNIQKLRDEEYSYEKYGRRRAYHNDSFTNHMLVDLPDYNSAIFDNGKNNKALHMDALEALKSVENIDLVYLDPPYPGTMNKYDEFYGAFDDIFDSHINYTDITEKSAFLNYFEELVRISQSKSTYLAISLNSRSTPSIEELKLILNQFGEVTIYEKDHNYQVSGKATKNMNKEIIALLKFQNI